MAANGAAAATVWPVEDRCKLAIEAPLLQDVRTTKFRLSTGLEVYAVTDPGCLDSGAAMSVETGSWNDAADAQGTAHFLEHMLFLGTGKYPDESEYDRYIKDHGGHMNAYTAADHTTYMLSVSNDAFSGALDRFAQFFHAPLFNPSCVEREMNAVDEEFRKNISEDGWRVLHVLKELANPVHPFTFFNTGNLDSMKLISQDTLKAWYRKYYIAPAMRLVLYSRQPPAWYLDNVARLFSPIAPGPRPVADASALAQVRADIKAVAPARLMRTDIDGHWLHVVPIKDLRDLTVTWEIDPALCARSSRTASLASHVIGHEGDGSLYAQLHRQGLIESLSAGPSNAGATNWSFSISAQLTEAGLARRTEVVEQIFAAVAQWEQSPFPAHILDERNTMAAVRYRFQSRGQVFDAVTRHAQQLRDEPLETYPTETILLPAVDGAQLAAFWQRLRPETCLITVVGPAALPAPGAPSTFRTERYMKASYRLWPFDATERARFAAARSGAVGSVVHYPAPNVYIPRALRALPASALKEQPLVVTPALLESAGGSTLYLLHDEYFGNPVVRWGVRLHTPTIRADNARSQCLTDLYLRLAHEKLTPLSYPAAHAGLSFNVGAMPTGLGLSLSGYADGTLAYWDACLATLTTMAWTSADFERLRDQLMLDYRNALASMVVSQAMQAAGRSHLVHPVRPEDKLAMLATLTVADVVAFQQELFRSTFLETMIGGAVDPDMARAVQTAARARLQAGAADAVAAHVAATVKQLPALRADVGSALTVTETTTRVPGYAAVLLIDGGPADVAGQTLTEMLAALVQEPFYSELRTKQQTGYIVHSGSTLVQVERSMLYLASQSSLVTPPDLLARYEAFLTEMAHSLAEALHAPKHPLRSRFANIQQSKVTQLSQPLRNLGEMVSIAEMLAFDRRGAFDRRALRLDYTRALAFDEFARWALGRLPAASYPRRVRVELYGLQRATQL